MLAILAHVIYFSILYFFLLTSAIAFLVCRTDLFFYFYFLLFLLSLLVTDLKRQMFTPISTCDELKREKPSWLSQGILASFISTYICICIFRCLRGTFQSIVHIYIYIVTFMLPILSITMDLTYDSQFKILAIKLFIRTICL